MWIYVDDKWRVLAYNPNDMSGNTGWYETNDPMFEAQNDADDNTGIVMEQPAAINVELFDSRGIPLYRYDLETDTIIERTQEEMDGDYVEPVPTPSDAERITALENQLSAYEAAYTEGVNEA